MSTILTAAAVTAMLNVWAGHRLDTRRMATLQTAHDIAVHATTDRLIGTGNRSALTRRLVQLDRQRRPFVPAIVNLDPFSTTHQWGYRIGDQRLVLQHGKRTAGATTVLWRRGLPALRRLRRDSRRGTPTAGQR